MSPTRKAKPPDKGAPPEHKPSRKVALEEVMRSLQDLVNNELAIDTAKQPDKSTTSESKKPRTTGNLPDVPATPPHNSDTTFAETTSESESITLETFPDSGTSTAEPQAGPKPVIPAGGLQQELPYLDALSPASSVRQSDNDASGIPSASSTNDADRITRSKSAAMPSTEEIPATPDELDWDDIPVLEEAVEFLEESELNETGQTGGNRTSPLPRADAARRLAIQVAARLNVELRKSGQAGLSSDIITRLARLLQEALAKNSSTGENTAARNGGIEGQEAGTHARAVHPSSRDR